MHCCKNKLELCLLRNCEKIEFGTYMGTGMIYGMAAFAGNMQKIDIDTTNGKYTINGNVLNENACYTIKLFNSDNTTHHIVIGGVEFDCITIKTYSTNA